MGSRENMNKMILDNVIRVTQLSSVKVERGTNNAYLPQLKRGNIVSCEFTGLGTEYNDTHFAIVWSAPPNDESIIVIPMTSQPKLESMKTFTIGKIENFVTSRDCLDIKESWVHLGKIREVSRKRISPWFQINTSSGNNIADRQGNNLKVVLSDLQIIRINDGIKLFLLNEGKCLCDYIQEINANWILDYNTVELLHGYRLIYDYSFTVTDDNNAIIKYSCNTIEYNVKAKKIDKDKFDSAQHKSLYTEHIYYKENRYKRRKEIVKALFSNNQDKINNAKALIDNIT
ncbi:hypothetical protein GCM10023142_36660 [Anaerocolumna aminovalerica]|uniref:PemK-like, MazF-like toxin of type II toxin-antitoxin system n=1 Tax=Anaerocolumna aminovalerica TaxID=1527 RepID=A0A1I5H758_9FIRM|nr:type II toxin-antitoxin system PemK/MazF family toxin [Anaerocolumna aminovalerica]SFO44009.1 PemK-like, MazF-like toxin of type II toxin-antitoxin system [Anaerocolumna aminovalerica]